VVQPVQGVRAHKALLRQPIELGSFVGHLVDTETRLPIRVASMPIPSCMPAAQGGSGKHVKHGGSRGGFPSTCAVILSLHGVAEGKRLADVEEMINRQVMADTQSGALEDVPIDVAVDERISTQWPYRRELSGRKFRRG